MLSLKEVREKYGCIKPILVKILSCEYEIIFLPNNKNWMERTVMPGGTLWYEVAEDFSMDKCIVLDYFESETILNGSSFSEKEQRLGPCTCKSFIGLGHENECKWGKE